jgi:type VI secretion system secreted protein Hcp
MRKVVLTAIVLLTAANLFAASSACSQPNLVVTGIQGDMQGPCSGAIDFASATFSAPSTTGNSSSGGSGAGKIVPGTLQITKYFDTSSPSLMLACANGTHIPKATLSYPSAQSPVTITFENVMIGSVNESVNPTNESVAFNYTKLVVESGGGTHVTGNVLGSARAAALNVAVVGSDGKSQPPTHVSLTVRPGGTTFNSVQLAPPSPGNAPTTRAGVAKSSQSPAESIHFNSGKIEFESKNSTASFHFDGGTLVNGNLRASTVNYTGPATGVVRPQ